MDRNDVLAVSALPELIVALRKESVDRNGIAVHRLGLLMMSLSARRAWIEITTYLDTSSIDDCRSPQGERG